MVKEPWGDRVLRALPGDIEAVPALGRVGRMARIEGLPVEVAGAVGLGGSVRLTSSHGTQIPFEAAGLRDGRAFLARKKNERAALAEGCAALDDIAGGKGKAP
jgi:hypothetical protein